MNLFNLVLIVFFTIPFGVLLWAVAISIVKYVWDDFKNRKGGV